MNFAFSDAVTVITGAGSGIGEACAHSFAKRGARVLVTDINAERAEKVAADIGDAAAAAKAGSKS